jgi:hypothetical protein
MITRCCNPNQKAYKNCGGRGVRVCRRWRASFAAFLEDVGPRPSPRHTIERINNSGHYEPGNCRWATRGEQARNSRRNRLLTVRGETLCLAAWAERLGLKRSTVSARLGRGWSPRDALRPGLDPRRRTG